MNNALPESPVLQILGELKQALETETNAVLVAPTGSGKTTRIPLMLLHERWLAGKRILLLEPRRMAARMAASHMASALGEGVGDTVGYRVRHEAKVGARIEVITEGILIRMLQSDPALEGVGLVIFDEFHERNLQADLGLALAMQAKAVLRGDLRLLAMSATLDAQPVAGLLGGAPVLIGRGRSFPVEVRYLPKPVQSDRLEQTMLHAIREAIGRDEGDILVFLPGAPEIRSLQRRLAGLWPDGAVRIAPLYGSLPQREQDFAVARAADGRRKVVLATTIAETSLTIEGVRVVIDSGLTRVPRFSPRTGMTRLETVRVARSSAEQRRGRAGRLEPGVCYRMWSEQEDAHLQAHRLPEVLEADLAPLKLELATWGVSRAEELRWLDMPPQAALQQAQELLLQLGAVDQDGRITPHGRRMAGLGAHPRLAHMLVRGAEMGLADLACELAALLGERDFIKGAARDCDLRTRIAWLRRAPGPAQAGSAADSGVVDPFALKAVAYEAGQWKKTLRTDAKASSPIDSCGSLLALAYPDRVGKNRGDGRFLMRNGRGAAFQRHDPLAAEPYIVAAELDDQGAESRIFLAAPLRESELERLFGDQIASRETVFWDAASQSIRARKQFKLGALLLKEAAVSRPDSEQTLAAWARALEDEGLALLPWTKAARQYQQRNVFMQSVDPQWPDFSDAALAASLHEWLAPHLYGKLSKSELKSLKLAELLAHRLDWSGQRRLEEWAPAHFTVPSGSRIPIDYSDPAQPVLAVRLQEMFGLRQTPAIALGRRPLLLHLLSPAQRPVQVTKDLISFWNSGYFEVRKDLKGRYPKHHWPDDPLNAAPTNRTKPRS